MTHEEHLWSLLLPLGPYTRQGVYTAGELKSEGEALDGAGHALEELEREAFPDTAEGWGLERLESLLARKPVAETAAARRQALAALLRIGGDSFTLAAVNDNLKGCGLNAAVWETGEEGLVEVTFPDVPGIPDGFEELKAIIEEIIPCHLEISYVYWYVTWALLEEQFPTWSQLGEGDYTWEGMEKLVKKE